MLGFIRRTLSCALVIAAFACGQTAPRELTVTAGKSIVVDSPVDIIRVSVADPEIAEAVGVSPREVVLNGRKLGQTSVIVWQAGGNRLFFDVTVNPAQDRAADKRFEMTHRELEKEFPGQKLQLSVHGENVYLRGTVSDLAAADRASTIAASLGKPVNLLRVAVSEAEPQILLKVRFASVDRSALKNLGLNLLSTGAAGTIGSTSTGQFSPNRLSQGGQAGNVGNFLLSDLLNVFLFRPDLDLGVTIKLLAENRLAEILAEPNVLAANGKEAAFLAGGEFPYPVVQGGGLQVPTVSIQFREFGVRLNFVPTITSRGSIRLEVEPEVSALDFNNALTYQGFTIPALSTRRVSTEIELQDRQSFAIAGLLDNRMSEVLSKMPGLGDIPLIGKLFQSKALKRENSELLVMVTPEIVRPMDEGQKQPEIAMPYPFLPEGVKASPRTPGIEQTGAAKPKAKEAVPYEVLVEEQRRESEADQQRRQNRGQSGMGSQRGSTGARSAAGRSQE